MKNFLYSRFVKNLIGLVSIITLALAVFGGIVLYALGNTFTSSDLNCNTYYETSHFNNSFYNEATSLLHNIKSLYEFSDYENISDDSVGITLFDYKTNDYISYSYSFLNDNKYNLHVPYTFSMSYSLETDSETTDYLYANADTTEAEAIFSTDYTSAASLTNISDTNSYYILSCSEYSKLIMQYGVQNQKSNGNLVSEDFSSDSYIYASNNYLLVYSPNEDSFFSSVSGWMTSAESNGLLFNSEQVSSYGTNEEGILHTAPEDYFSVVDTIVNNYYENSETFNYLYSSTLDSPLIYYISGYGFPSSYSNVTNYDSKVITPSYKDVIGNSIYFFYYNKATNNLDTNLDFEFSDFSGYVPNSNHASGVIAIGVPAYESSYNYSIFYKGQILFDYCLINYKLIILVTLVSLLISILGFATLISITGRSAKASKAITLYIFDTIFTEITIVPFAASLILFALSCIRLIECISPWHPYSIYDIAFGLALLILCEFVIVATGLSLVRLFKSSRFIKQSLIYKILLRLKNFIKIFIEGKSATFRAGLIFSIFAVTFLVLVFFMIICAANYEGAIAVLLMIIFCIVLLFGGAMQIYDAYALAKITTAIKEISNGNLDYKVVTSNLNGQQIELAKNVNNIGAGLQKAIETSIKDERLKAELITNVSHDIKTPLTSIINYVDLLKRENIEDETILHYIDVLEQKSSRLKYLTDALVEASKVTTGNIDLNLVSLNLTELLNQTIGEFEDKFSEVNLTVVDSISTERTIIYADGQRTYRILENLFQNIYKYAMPGTRVYIDLSSDDDTLALSIKNISNHQLNISPDELTERFIRGDESRTTEGSGLGLSISKDLTELQNGTFNIQLDGDLFKTIITFKIYEAPTEETVQ